MLVRGILYVGNKLPTLTATLTDATGTPIDLTGATVQFAMRGEYATSNLFRNAAAVVGSPPLGNVRYDLATNDLATATPGVYDARWIVTNGGLVEDVEAGQFEVRRSFA